MRDVRAVGVQGGRVGGGLGVNEVRETVGIRVKGLNDNCIPYTFVSLGYGWVGYLFILLKLVCYNEHCTFSSLTRSFSKGSTASSLFRALLYAGRESSEVADSLNCWYCVRVSCMPGGGGRGGGGGGRGGGEGWEGWNG